MVGNVPATHLFISSHSYFPFCTHACSSRSNPAQVYDNMASLDCEVPRSHRAGSVVDYIAKTSMGLRSYSKGEDDWGVCNEEPGSLVFMADDVDLDGEDLDEKLLNSLGKKQDVKVCVHLDLADRPPLTLQSEISRLVVTHGTCYLCHVDLGLDSVV